MSSDRPRTRAGLPLALIIAILTMILGGRLSRQQPSARGPAPTPSSAAAASPAPRPQRTPDVAARAPATDNRRDTPGFTNHAHLVEHFEKHGAEFPGLTIDTYLQAAQTLRDAPAGGDILELRRSDGVVTRFDKQSGAFLAANRDGTIRTFFRPNDGEAYFRRQAMRSPGGGP
jgi:pyocin large subunit-like protein